MAASDSIKPFSSDEIQRILQHLQQPAVFLNMTRGWPVLHWTAQHLSDCFGEKLIQFRLGKKEGINCKNTRSCNYNLCVINLLYYIGRIQSCAGSFLFLLELQAYFIIYQFQYGK